MIKNSAFKYGKWLIYLVIFAILAQVIMNYIFSLDEMVSKIESRLLIDQELKSQIGEFKKIKLTQRTSIYSSENNPSYMLYDFLVVGKKATALVIVRVESIDAPPQQQQISISSIHIK